ncbi:MAG: nucleotidyltransferase domain-containing protein [Candidatus Bathyarchaeia archaeon]
MWPQRWIGTLYSNLYAEHYNNTFTFSDVMEFTKSPQAAKVALTRMRQAAILCEFDRVGRRRLYRLGEPDVMLLSISKIIRNPRRVMQGRYGRLIGLISVELIKRIVGIRSIVLYGSTARGVAERDSDVDILTLMDSEETLGRRLDRLVAVERCERVEEELQWLSEHGVYTHISFLPLRVEEAEGFPPVMLDIIEDGLIIADDGAYETLRRGLKERLERVGARRVFISEDEWYWDLKPDLKFGEVFTL